MKKYERIGSILGLITLDKQLSSRDLITEIVAGHGKATLIDHGFRWRLTATQSEKDIVLTDYYKTQARIIKPDVVLKNGIIHVIDAVVMPKPTPGPNGDE